MLIVVWIISSIVLFFLFQLHFYYAEELLGNRIYWAVSWEFFLSLSVFFISSLLFTKITSTKIKTSHRFIFAYLLPIALSIIVFASFPENYHESFYDGKVDTLSLEHIINETIYLVCLTMAISHIFWLKQEYYFYKKEKTHYAITTLLVVVSFLLASIWRVEEILRGI